MLNRILLSAYVQSGVVSWLVARKIYALRETKRVNDPLPLQKYVRLTEDEWQFCQRFEIYYWPKI